MTPTDDNPASAEQQTASAALSATQPTSAARPDKAPVPTSMRKADRHQPTTLQITSEELFAGAAEVQIEHHGATYRLKHTSLGKLILTK